jgi:hypothetical protein
MKGKIILIAILATFAMTLTFGAGGALAAGHTEEPSSFFISVKHFVKGDEIGLPREAAVNIQVIRNGQTLAYLPMEFRDRVDANLPGGEYEFIFLDQASGATLFECGPYMIENGDDVRVQAHEQGPGRIPTCFVRK